MDIWQNALPLPDRLNLDFEFILLFSAHGKYDVSYKSNIVLYQQGGLLWIPPAIYKSSCQINVKYFPFDQQVSNY